MIGGNTLTERAGCRAARRPRPGKQEIVPHALDRDAEPLLHVHDIPLNGDRRLRPHGEPQQHAQ